MKERKITKSSSKQLGEVNRNSFEILYPIGKGGFGKVWKVQHKKTKQVYALK
jgi:serine/threonine protein kinase